MKPFAFLAALMVVGLSGCASIMTGSDQDIHISSSPSQATIQIFDNSNMKVWDSTTPTTVSLKRGDGYFSGATYRVEVSKEGYETQIVQITSTLNGGWYIGGNILVGGLIGWLIVDPLTGAMWTLRPDRISPDLSSSQSSTGETQSINIVLREDLPEQLASALIPLGLN